MRIEAWLYEIGTHSVMRINSKLADSATTTLLVLRVHYPPVRCYDVLHCAMLHYATLHYAILCYTTLYYTMLHYTTLHYATLRYTML